VWNIDFLVFFFFIIIRAGIMLYVTNKINTLVFYLNILFILEFSELLSSIAFYLKKSLFW